MLVLSGEQMFRFLWTLDLHEMGLPEELTGEIIAIKAVPDIPPGRGRVVLTNVNYFKSVVVELTLSNQSGQTEVIKPTAIHQVRVEDERTWCQVDTLKTGYEIRTESTEENGSLSSR